MRSAPASDRDGIDLLFCCIHSLKPIASRKMGIVPARPLQKGSLDMI
jgi:hypothetical protein